MEDKVRGAQKLACALWEEGKQRQKAFQEDSLQKRTCGWTGPREIPNTGSEGNMRSVSSFAHRCFSTDLQTSHPYEECPLMEQVQHSWPQELDRPKAGVELPGDA